MVGNSDILEAVLAVAKIGGGLAVAKTGDMAVCVAVRGWGGVLAVAVVTAKIDGGDVDIAT